MNKAALGLLPTFLITLAVAGTRVGLCEYRTPSQCGPAWDTIWVVLGVGGTGGGLAAGYAMENPAITRKRQEEAAQLVSAAHQPVVDAAIDLAPVPPVTKRMAKAAARLPRK